MFDHPQIESLLKQLKARSMVIVYQILRHSLLRCALQGNGQPPGRRGERRWAIPIQQATLGSGTVLVIVPSYADGRMGAISSLKKPREGAALVFLFLGKDLYPAWALHGAVSVHLDL